MIYLFWFVNVAFFLAISALAAWIFVPALKKLLTRSFSEDILRFLLIFAVVAIFVAGLAGGGAISDRDIQGFRYGMWEWDVLFIRLSAVTVDILSKVAQALACIFVVAVAVYLLSPKREGGEGTNT